MTNYAVKAISWAVAYAAVAFAVRYIFGGEPDWFFVLGSLIAGFILAGVWGRLSRISAAKNSSGQVNVYELAGNQGIPDRADHFETKGPLAYFSVMGSRCLGRDDGLPKQWHHVF